MKRSSILVAALTFILGFTTSTYANVYATNLEVSATVITTGATNSTVDISFLLNEDADSGVDVKIYRGDSLAYTISLATATKGSNSVSWGGTNAMGTTLPDGDYNFEVTAADDGYASWTKISDDLLTVMYSPKGVAINRNLESPKFGTVYISNGVAGTSANAGAAYNGDGLIMFNAAQAELGFSNGGQTWASTNAPGKSSIGEDDRVYVTEYGLDEIFVFDAEISLASAYRLLDADNKVADQWVQGNWVTGSGADRAIYTADGHYATGQGILKYTIGLDDTLAAGNFGELVVARPNNGYYQRDVEVDSQGNIYFCQMRADPNQAFPLLKYPPYTGTTLTIDDTLWTVPMTYSGAQGIALDEASNRIAWGSYYSGTVYVHDATTGALLETIATGQSRTQDLAFDAAGNLYTIDNGSEYWHIWSAPDGANEFTSPGLATISIETPALASDVLINEFDTNTSAAEYIEIYNNTDLAIDLATDSYVLVFLNGSSDLVYQATDLTGSLPASGFYVVAEAGVTDIGGYTPDLNATWTSFQNGQDGFALVKGAAASDFAVNAVYSTSLATVSGASQQDAVIYGTTADPGLETEFGLSGILIANGSTGSSARITDGLGGADYANADWEIALLRTAGASNVAPPMMVSAFSISDTEIEVVYSADMTAVDVADYSLAGTAGVTFTTATLDAVDASLVHLVAAATIMGDIVVDTLLDASLSDSFVMYAGIMPIGFTNALNPGGQIEQDIPGTYAGLVTANDAFNNVWVKDGNEAYMGVLVYDYDLDGLVAVGDEIMFTGVLDIYNNLSELKNAVLLGVESSGNPTVPAIITGADIDSSLAADTNPAEQWEGQLVKIDGATVLAYDGATYTYELTDDGSVTKFLLGDNVDYHLGLVSLTVGTEYSVAGVVDYTAGNYRINPRSMDDVVEVTNNLDLTFEDDSDNANWGVHGGATGYTTVAYDATAGVDGTGAIVFGDGGYAYYIKRPVGGTIGADYFLSVDVKTVGWDTPETYPITLAIEGLDVAENSISINSLTEFTTITLTGAITSADGYIKLQGSNTSAAGAGGTISVTLDNLVFIDEYIPPPDLDLDLTFDVESDAANWGVYDGATGYTTVAHDLTAGVDGTGTMVFGDGGYAYYIKRPIAATPGTDYSLSIDIKTVGWDVPETYPITLAVEGLDAVENAISINSLTDFTTITLTGTATNADGYIKLQGSNTSAAGAGGTISVTIDNLMFDDNLGIADLEPPTLVSVLALSSSIVELVFSEDMDPVTAGTITNYVLDHEVGSPASVTVNEEVVLLTLSTSMQFDSTYTVIINNVGDLSGNILLADTASFMYSYEFVVDLFFSEYIEGSSNNKALELYNPTDVEIDLSGYTIGGTSNDATDWEFFYTFPDTALTIGPLSTYVIADASAAPELLALSDWAAAYPGPTSYNGNDARGLFKIVGIDTILIDALGDFNNPSAAMYSVAGVESGMLDHTIVRKAPITMGNADWMISSGIDEVSSEWVLFPQNTFRFLGAHPHVDLVGPALAGVVAVSENQIQVRFDEPVDSTDARTLTNYSVSDDLGSENPTAVTMLTDKVYVLDVPALAANMPYTVAASGIHDLSGNEMMVGSMLDVVLDIPGNLPIDRIMNDFVTGIGNWGHPTYSGSTTGILGTSTFASTDSLAFAGTNSGEMVLLDDPAVSGGWFIRLWNINRVDRIDADSKMFFYLRGGNADMQARIVVKDDDGYEAGPWHDITYAEDDWQVVSVDLANDAVTGWITGNGSITAASGSVAIDCIQIQCSEDVSTTLFLDMITERSNIDPVTVTFDVNMAIQVLMETFDMTSDFLDVAGNFSGWGDVPMVLDDPEADSVYTITLTDIYPGETLEYKFRINGNWDTSEFPGGGPNRVYVVPDSNSVLEYYYDDVDTYVGINNVGLPTEFALHGNYPNPFNPITNIKYDIPENTSVTLTIYNLIGQHVIDLVNEDQAPGFYHIQWNGLDKSGAPVSSGLYIYRLTTPEFTRSEKMTFLK